MESGKYIKVNLKTNYNGKYLKEQSSYTSFIIIIIISIYL